MPNQPGLFDSFDNLDQIEAEAIASWLQNPPKLVYLQNYLANKILYPQTLPQTASDMQIDLAMLREALKMSQVLYGVKASYQTSDVFLGNNPFLNIILRKILIPARFLEFVPDLVSLSWAFIDALLLNRKKENWFQDLWTIVLTDDSDEIVGSIILPQFDSNEASLEINLLGKIYQILPRGITIIPCSKDRCEIVYKLRNGRILGKTDSAVEVYGGKLGLLIDGRSI